MCLKFKCVILFIFSGLESLDASPKYAWRCLTLTNLLNLNGNLQLVAPQKNKCKGIRDFSVKECPFIVSVTLYSHAGGFELSEKEEGIN